MGAFINLGDHKTPHYLRFMAFMDGTNPLSGLSNEIEVEFKASKPTYYFVRDSI
jgi:hypothetical protein